MRIDYSVSEKYEKYTDKALSVTKVCRSEENIKYIILVLHGFAEHKGRYNDFFEKISSDGGLAIAYDNRGCGLTASGENELGVYGPELDHIGKDINLVLATALDFSFSDSIELTDEEIQSALEEINIPVFILGFSMGSLEALYYTSGTDLKLNGVILAGLPRKHPFVNVGRLLAFLVSVPMGDEYKSHLLNHIAYSVFNKKFDGDGDTDYLWLSEDSQNRENFRNDPLCGAKHSTGAFRYLMKLDSLVYNPSIYDCIATDTPIMILSGENDPIAGGDRSVLKAEKFLRDMKYTDIKNIVYNNMRHEIFFETYGEYPQNDVIDFINSHLEIRKTEDYTSIFQE